MAMRNTIGLFVGLVAAICAWSDEAPSRESVTSAMSRATDFLFDALSYRNGFVWLVTVEGERFGELKARPSMIWVEPPGTPSVGLVLLEAYRATGDAAYMERAKAVADALAAGQHPSGGWNYFIDFDPEGLPAYYDEFFSKCWGWQEYLKERPNATFDDYTTTEATRFFLRLYDATKDPAHRAVLDKALGHILAAQDRSGGWPQRYPAEPGVDDYTSALTFNDDVAYDCILVLLEAHETLGDERYRTASKRGMDFYIASQLPAPQAGWAQQYGRDMKPVWGRPFEIASVCAPETHTNILNLFEFYQRTGDGKYLAPIPAALDWLDSAVIPNDEGFTHTCFYELETNRPIYIKQTGTTVEDVRYEPTYEEEGCYPYAPRLTVPVAALRAEYERLSALGPEEAMAAFAAKANRRDALPEHIRGGYLATALAATEQSDAGVAGIIGALDERGGWRDDVALLDPFQPFTVTPRKAAAYTTGGYIARMYRLINWLDGAE